MVILTNTQNYLLLDKYFEIRGKLYKQITTKKELRPFERTTQYKHLTQNYSIDSCEYSRQSSTTPNLMKRPFCFIYIQQRTQMSLSIMP